MDRYGIGRSIEPRGALPQQALRLDVTSPVRAGEAAIDVDLLNIDSASYRQMAEACASRPDEMAAHIKSIVAERGKLQNPVTGSGGMLVGTVSELGEGRTSPAVGARVATLVSLTLTPLVLEEVLSLDPNSEKVRVRGRAFLPPSADWALVPDDLPEEVVLGVLDVCGAPAWMARLAEASSKIVVIGAGGKSGILAATEAARRVGDAGRVIGLCWPEDTAVAAKEAGAEAFVVDCTDPVAVHRIVTEALNGEHADLVFVCANVPGCEGGALMACSDEGRVVFFSMATSFSSAALVAEGLGKSCEMTIGNGFVPGHADLALDLVRNDERLRARFAS